MSNGCCRVGKSFCRIDFRIMFLIRWCCVEAWDGIHPTYFHHATQEKSTFKVLAGTTKSFLENIIFQQCLLEKMPTNTFMHISVAITIPWRVWGGEIQQDKQQNYIPPYMIDIFSRCRAEWHITKDVAFLVLFYCFLIDIFQISCPDCKSLLQEFHPHSSWTKLRIWFSNGMF